MNSTEQRQLAIGREMENACASLPAGWTIIISLEENSANIELQHDERAYAFEPHDHGDTFADHVAASVKFAVEESSHS